MTSASDALVVFGITGDLAYKQIFPALQAMIQRGHLDVPIVGVARSGNLDHLRARARDSLDKHGGVDEKAFAQSDSDVVFQPRKVERLGLWEAVAGHVVIYIHTEQMLEDVEYRYPAHHYAVVARLWRAHRSGLLKRSLRAVADHAGRGRTGVALAL